MTSSNVLVARWQDGLESEFAASDLVLDEPRVEALYPMSMLEENERRRGLVGLVAEGCCPTPVELQRRWAMGGIGPNGGVRHSSG